MTILFPLLIVGTFLLLIRHRRTAIWRSNPRSDWQSGVAVSVIFLALAILWWNDGGRWAVLLQTGEPQFDVAVVLLIILFGWFYAAKIRRQRFIDFFTSAGYQPKDERETQLILRATQVAYAVTLGLLVIMYLGLLLTALPSKASLIYLFALTLILPRTAFSYTLDRHGFMKE